MTDWLKTPTKWEESAADRSVWRTYSTPRRVAYGAGLTVLSWVLGAGTLLLLGASGPDFWIVFVGGAVLFAGLFAVLASGNRDRMLASFRWFRGIGAVSLVLAAAFGLLALVLEATSGG